MEESACRIGVTGLLGVYLWIHPQTRQNFLRIVYMADLLGEIPNARLDDGIHAVHWFTLDDLEKRRRYLRTPAVIRSIQDYLAGNRQPDSLLSDMMPVQHNVHEVLASAHLL